MAEPPRSRAQRIDDARRRLDADVDAWIATADPATGAPYLVPLSFLWEGETLLFATLAASRTARNLAASGWARIGLGLTRDVVMIDGMAELIETGDLPRATGDAFARRTGFDPRTEPEPYRYVRIRPDRIQAWREANELAGRDVMRAGRWL